MGVFDMVFGIVIVTAIAGVLRARYGVVRPHKGEAFVQRGPDPETLRLRDEVKSLKDRVAVLERILTDNNSGVMLDREIEALRARD